MKTKKIFITMILLLVAPAMFFAESEDSTITFDKSSLDATLLVSTKGLFDSPSMVTPQGTPVTAKQVNEMLRTVQENEAVMRSYTAWKSASWIMMGIMVASFAGDITLDALKANGTVTGTAVFQNICKYVSFISLFASLNSSLIANHKRHIAIDNYNLSQIEKFSQK